MIEDKETKQMKLDEALQKVDPHGCDEEVVVIIQAAKKYALLLEARKNATAGEWVECKYNDEIVRKDAIGSNIFAYDGLMDNDLNFITLAANTLEEDTER